VNDLSVGPSVCPVHCGKTADRILLVRFIELAIPMYKKLTTEI